MKERIAAAAIRMQGVVFTGIRHHLIMHDMRHTHFCKKEHVNDGVQGFITTTGRFVGREEARVIADAAGQIRYPLPNASERLYSEELWEDYGGIIATPRGMFRPGGEPL